MDAFSDYYSAFLDGQYDCVDRIVLNAYYPLGMSPGGFRTWWRALHGTDDDLDNAHLMRMAGRFGRRARGWAKKNGVPVIDCAWGERKHELAEQYLPTAPRQAGVFCILVGRAPYPVWDVRRFGTNGIDLRRKKAQPYVNHYSFHIWDRDWGHVTVKMCGHPPFTAQIILNGHEYVACQAQKKGLVFSKEDNCFTDITDAAALGKAADTLRSTNAIGRLNQVCARWVNWALCLALDVTEQQKSGFRYQFSIYQAEYSRNLLFQRGRDLDTLFNGVIDRTRTLLDIPLIKTIFGYRQRPSQRSGEHPREEVVTETPRYDLTVFKIHAGPLTLKMYSKGERVLRIEVIVHNAGALPCGRVLAKFVEIVGRLQSILERFMQVVRCVDASCLEFDVLETLPTASQVGSTRVGGVDWNKPRMRAVLQAVIALAVLPEGITSAAVAAKVRECLACSQDEYQPRHASYDLKKLRGKQWIDKIEGTHRYEARAHGLQTMAALLVLRDKILKPILAGSTSARPQRKPKQQGRLDEHYQVIRAEMQTLMQELGIAA